MNPRQRKIWRIMLTVTDRPSHAGMERFLSAKDIRGYVDEALSDLPAGITAVVGRPQAPQTFGGKK